MFKDEKTGKDFAGSQNPWIKRLGLFFVIVGLSFDFWTKHPILLVVILLVIILLAIVWGILKFFVRDIKDLFK